jgi:hypothetical protein
LLPINEIAGWERRTTSAMSDIKSLRRKNAQPNLLWFDGINQKGLMCLPFDVISS